MGNKKKPGKKNANSEDPKVLRQVLLDFACTPDRSLFKFEDDRVEKVGKKSQPTRVWTDLRNFLYEKGLVSVRCSYDQVHRVFANHKPVRDAWGLQSPPKRKRITADPFYKASLAMPDEGAEPEDNEYAIPPCTDKDVDSMKRMEILKTVKDSAGTQMSLTKLRYHLSTEKLLNQNCKGSARARRFVVATVIDLMANIIFKPHYQISHVVFPSTFYWTIHKITIPITTKEGKKEEVDVETCKAEEFPNKPVYTDAVDYSKIKPGLEGLNENPMEKEVVLIPVILYKHCSVLAIYPAQKVATYHDGVEHIYKNMDKRIEVFWQILDGLHEHFLGKPCTGWTLRRVVDKKGVVQRSPSDCVLVSLWTMELLLGRHPIKPSAFTEHSMINYRRQVLCELAHGEIKWQRPQPRQAWPPGHFEQGEKTPNPTLMKTRSQTARRDGE